MPFCSDCGTEVSEDTRFCPECGCQLSIGQDAKGTGKKKISGIIAACIVALIVIVAIVTRPPTPAEPEPVIPAHFTTYTDELGLFSISYPPEWELHLGVIEEREQAARDIMRSIDSDLPVEKFSCLFIAGLPTVIGHDPNVNIVVEPLSGAMRTHDEVVTAGIEQTKALLTSDYYEFSRVKTTVDNRTATIIKYQGAIAGLGTGRYVTMISLRSKTVWVVTCAAFPSEYSRWEDDFDAIVRSLRILK